MSSLSGLQPKQTFGDLLHMGNNGNGLGEAPGQIYDGSGKPVPMRVSNTSIALDRLQSYRLAATTTEGVIDLDVANVFRITANAPKTISFVNTPGSNVFLTIVIVVSGNTGALTWPSGIVWDAGIAPTLGANKTVITLVWDGTTWIGNMGAKA